MRILGIDYGDARIGLALSDASATLCGRAWTLAEWNLDRAVDAIADVVRAEGVERIVLGYPKNMNNTEGERCEKTKEFAQMLERRTGLSVVLWDERLTTVAADRHMMESGIRRENRKQYVDEIAAVFILQGYLDSLAFQKH